MLDATSFSKNYRKPSDKQMKFHTAAY